MGERPTPRRALVGTETLGFGVTPAVSRETRGSWPASPQATTARLQGASSALTEQIAGLQRQLAEQQADPRAAGVRVSRGRVAAAHGNEAFGTVRAAGAQRGRLSRLALELGRDVSQQNEAARTRRAPSAPQELARH